MELFKLSGQSIQFCFEGSIYSRNIWINAGTPKYIFVITRLWTLGNISLYVSEFSIPILRMIWLWKKLMGRSVHSISSDTSVSAEWIEFESDDSSFTLISGILDNASATAFCFPGRCLISKSYSDNWSLHLTSFEFGVLRLRAYVRG